MAICPARFICYSLWLWFGVTQGRQVGKVGNSTPPGQHEDGLLSFGNLHLCIPHSNRDRPPQKNTLFTLWTAGASIERQVVEWCEIATAATTGPPKPGKMGGVRYAVASPWAQVGRRRGSLARPITPGPPSVSNGVPLGQRGPVSQWPRECP